MVFSCRFRGFVVVAYVFSCIKLTWVCSVVLETYTLKGYCPYESCSNSGGRENYSLYFGCILDCLEIIVLVNNAVMLWSHKEETLNLGYFGEIPLC